MADWSIFCTSDEVDEVSLDMTSSLPLEFILLLWLASEIFWEILEVDGVVEMTCLVIGEVSCTEAVVGGEHFRGLIFVSVGEVGRSRDDTR